MKTNGKLRALIVGLGTIGRRHLENLRSEYPECHITVLRRSKTGAKEATSGFADAIVDTLEDALASAPEVAIVATPAAHHIKSSLALARHGVHLLVEKPLADTMEGVAELVAACVERKLVLMTGYNLRFHEPLLTLRHAVQQGRIGRVLIARAEVGQYLPDWRPAADYRQTASARAELGGGAVLELSHEFDYLRWLVGEVTRVTAFTGRVSSLDLDVEDAAEISLVFANGALGSVSLNMVQRVPGRSCRLVGETGTLEWDAPSGQCRLYSVTTKAWTNLCPAHSLDWNEMYRTELRHFVDCVRSAAAPQITIWDGQRTLQIALAVKQSMREGRAISI